MSKIAGRTRARVQAIQLLFQAQIQGLDVFDLLRDGTYALEDGPVDPFAEELARGVAVNRLAIERMLDNISTCWSYSRMPIVDRAILRASVCEIYFIEDVPVSVSINEAVELAKEFGGEDESSRFVNGILGRIARTMDSDEEANWNEEGSETDPEDVAEGEAPADGVAVYAAQSDEACESCDSGDEEGTRECERPAASDADAVDGQ